MSDNEEYEYEYVELPEGEEYADGEYEYEYEYVEEEGYEEQPHHNIDETVVADVAPEIKNPFAKNQPKEDACIDSKFLQSDFDIDLDNLINDGDNKKTSFINDIDDNNKDLDLSDLLNDDGKDIDLSVFDEDILEPISIDDLDNLQDIAPIKVDEVFEAEPAAKIEEKSEPHAFIPEEKPVAELVEEFEPEELFDIVEEEPLKEEEQVIAKEDDLSEQKAEVIEPKTVSTIGEVEKKASIKLTPISNKFNLSVQALPREYDAKIQVIDENTGYKKVNGNTCNYSMLVKGIEEASLLNWKLVVFQKELYSLDSSTDDIFFERNNELARYLCLIKNGSEKINIFEKNKIKLSRPTKRYELVDAEFLISDTQNSGLFVEDYIVLNLSDYKNKCIDLGASCSGILVGDNGNLIFFYNIEKFFITSYLQANAEADNHLDFYSQEDARSFEFSKSSEDTSFQGDEEIDTIHVDVGNNFYGWNIFFENGVIMSIADLIEYQLKNGGLPSSRGRIVHGDKKLDFSNVKRIVVYKTPQYFSYSI